MKVKELIELLGDFDPEDEAQLMDLTSERTYDILDIEGLGLTAAIAFDSEDPITDRVSIWR